MLWKSLYSHPVAVLYCWTYHTQKWHFASWQNAVPTKPWQCYKLSVHPQSNSVKSKYHLPHLPYSRSEYCWGSFCGQSQSLAEVFKSPYLLRPFLWLVKCKLFRRSNLKWHHCRLLLSLLTPCTIAYKQDPIYLQLHSYNVHLYKSCESYSNYYAHTYNLLQLHTYSFKSSWIYVIIINAHACFYYCYHGNVVQL